MTQVDCFSRAYRIKPSRLKSSRLSPAITSISSSSCSWSMANWMSFTAPSRVSLLEVPSSRMVMEGRPSAHCRKMGANLWLLITTYSSMSPVRDISSMSQSKMGFPATSKRGLGKFSVRGYRRVAYPAARIRHFIILRRRHFHKYTLHTCLPSPGKPSDTAP